MTAAKRAPAGPQTYVVQRQIDSDRPTMLWEDIATVTVPPRSKRKTIIEKALAEPDMEFPLPATLRVLDADSAVEVPVRAEPREPELVIG